MSVFARTMYLAADLLVVGMMIRILFALHGDLLAGIVIGASVSLLLQIDASAMFVILRYERSLRRTQERSSQAPV